LKKTIELVCAEVNGFLKQKLLLMSDSLLQFGKQYLLTSPRFKWLKLLLYQPSWYQSRVGSTYG